MIVMIQNVDDTNVVIVMIQNVEDTNVVIVMIRNVEDTNVVIVMIRNVEDTNVVIVMIQNVEDTKVVVVLVRVVAHVDAHKNINVDTSQQVAIVILSLSSFPLHPPCGCEGPRTSPQTEHLFKTI